MSTCLWSLAVMNDTKHNVSVTVRKSPGPQPEDKTPGLQLLAVSPLDQPTSPASHLLALSTKQADFTKSSVRRRPRLKTTF